MTVNELYEFLKEAMQKLEKRLDKLDGFSPRMATLEFQMKIVWGILSFLFVTSAANIVKGIFDLIIK